PADELIAEDGEQYERDVERVHHPPIAPGNRGKKAILPLTGCPDLVQPRNGLNSVRPDSPLPADALYAPGSQFPRNHSGDAQMPVSSCPAKRLCLVLIASALNVIDLGGCATPPSQVRAVRPVDITTHAGLPRSLAAESVPAHLVPVERFGRYTLVEISPAVGQVDLMQQIVDVSMPPTLVASVGDALRFVLLRSGFVLCDSPGIAILNTLPLPAADFHLGPLALESALRILAGPGWKLEVNE